ncbi:HNH endonuclease isoform A [Micractinium conductrix]|uniref:HNH endonuclease isoform A n=1 Tax=Micractinium conductrix TaxID=554055 RepID=A0A2P6V310_9CHLO|nr:HNH endonuclease isoform A [Micractinium conductrix]|eukprot:PSC68471.1 HNH endonuclease isoform A [Micractinium conductrix]
MQPHELRSAAPQEQGVAFVRERDNPHDPHAVSIRTLDDRSLGYVARDQTFHFTQDLCFGAVGSVGQQGEQGLWGFNVLVQPSLPPVEALALPASQAPHLALGLRLRGAAWERVKAAVVAAGGGRCSITGAPLAAPAEQWVFDDGAHVLRLAGFRLVAPEVSQVNGLLALEGRRAAEGATELLQLANAWSSDDVAAYLAGVRAVAARRGAAEWRLDLEWLRERGVDPPRELVPP